MNFLSLVRQKAVQEIEADYNWIFEEKAKIVTFIQPYSYVIARKNIALYSRFDHFFFDGIFGTVMIRLFTRLKIRRRSFDMTSIARDIFEYGSLKGKTFYLVGTKQNLLEQAIQNILSEYPDLQITGSRNGYFNSDKEIDSAIDQIIEINPDYLIVGMGTPLQDEFLIKVKDRGWRGVGFTCGGFIHQTAPKLKYYPDILDRLHLRLIVRIFHEKYIGKRVIKYFPLFVFFLLKDLFNKK